MKRVLLFVFICLFIGGYQLFAQSMATVTYNNGKEQRLLLETFPSQTDKKISVVDVETGKDMKLRLDSLRSIYLESNEEIKEPSLFIPILVYINQDKQVKRWVELLYSSDYINVYHGYFTKGMRRNGNTVYIDQGSSKQPLEYYYLQRVGEKFASVWFAYHSLFGLSNNIGRKRKREFIKRSCLYFEHNPKLKNRIKNKEFGPADWKKLIKAYEEELKELVRTKSNNF